jgi:hypothetical protein
VSGSGIRGKITRNNNSSVRNMLLYSIGYNQVI